MAVDVRQGGVRFHGVVSLEVVARLLSAIDEIPVYEMDGGVEKQCNRPVKAERYALGVMG